MTRQGRASKPGMFHFHAILAVFQWGQVEPPYHQTTVRHRVTVIVSEPTGSGLWGRESKAWGKALTPGTWNHNGRGSCLSGSRARRPMGKQLEAPGPIIRPAGLFTKLQQQSSGSTVYKSSVLRKGAAATRKLAARRHSHVTPKCRKIQTKSHFNMPQKEL